MGIRSYTIKQLPLVQEKSVTLVPVFERQEEEVKDLYNKLLASDQVRKYLDKHRDVNLAYIMPGDFFLTALVTDEGRRFSDEIIERFPEVLEWHEHKFKGGLGKFFRIFYNFTGTLGEIETDYDIERFIFVSVIDRTGKPVTVDHIFDLGQRRRPALLVDYHLSEEQVVSVIETSSEHKWGTIPMPTF